MNLLWSIDDWYMKHYGPQLLVGPFVKRLLIIRAHVYEVNIPPEFNPHSEIPALDHIVDLPKALADLITGKERLEIQGTFNRMFNEGSRLAYLGVNLKRLNGHNSAYAAELFTRGLTDLHGAAGSFSRSDPGANLFSSAQQPVEKFLKAYISLRDASMDEAALRKFKHHLDKLVEEATKWEKGFATVKPYIAKVSIGPESRYHAKKLAAAEAIAVIDMAFAICNFVVQALLPETKPKAA